MYNEDTDSDADLMDSEEEAELREWEQSGYEYAAPEEEGDAVELVIAHRPGVEERQDIELEKAAGEYVDDGTSHPQLDDLRREEEHLPRRGSTFLARRKRNRDRDARGF